MMKKPEIQRNGLGYYRLFFCPERFDVVDACQSTGCPHWRRYRHENGVMSDIWRIVFGEELSVGQPVCNHPALAEPEAKKGGCTNWIKWNGETGQPLDNGTMVDVELRNGERLTTKAVDLRWGVIGYYTDIVAYRLHKTCTSCNDEGGVREHQCDSMQDSHKYSKDGNFWILTDMFLKISRVTCHVVHCQWCGLKLNKIPCAECGKVRGE